MSFSHLDADRRPTMVDVSDKTATKRAAVAEARVHFPAAVAAALRSTADNRQRVNATFAAYFEYVAEHSGTFKLVFESDFSNEPAVRARLADPLGSAAR